MGKFFGSRGAVPQLPATPELPAPPPALQSPQGAQAADDVRKRAAQAFGATATIRTSGQGVTTPAPTAQKSLLGG